MLGANIIKIALKLSLKRREMHNFHIWTNVTIFKHDGENSNWKWDRNSTLQTIRIFIHVKS